MKKEIVLDRLVTLYSRMFNGNIDVAWVDKHLLGSVFNITPRDLVYFFLEVEREFAVKIPESYIRNGDFCTLDKIANILVALKV